VDPLSVLIGWGEKLVSGFRQASRADLRIADQARLLRRQLAASFEDWPHGPTIGDELLTWAHRTARGFAVTQPGVDELVKLRPEASRTIRRAIGKVRDDFYAAADLIQRPVQTRWQVIDDQGKPKHADVAPLRSAFAHLRRCIATLDEVIAKHE
jgi:hypothetical protein